MALTTPQARACWKEVMDDLSNKREVILIDKNVLLDTINAIDAWIVSNATNFNQALPLAARQNLTASQKTRLLMAVARRRFIGDG